MTTTQVRSKSNVSPDWRFGFEIRLTRWFTNSISGVLADDGYLYVANFYNGDVIKIDRSGKASRLTTLSGNNNGHLTLHKGVLYVVARSANQIYRVTLDGKSSLFVATGKRGKTDGL